MAALCQTLHVGRLCTEYSNVDNSKCRKYTTLKYCLWSLYVDSGPFTGRLLWAKRLSNMEGRLQKVIISVRAVYQTTTNNN